MERRSLFQTIFGRVKGEKPQQYNRYQMLNGYNATFTPWGNNPYEADVVRGAVDAVARNAAKLKARHVRRLDGAITPLGSKSQLDSVLQIRPNPNMSAYDFFYKVVTTLMIENNAFMYPVWEGMNLLAIWPINCASSEFLEDDAKNLYIRFWFGAGQQVVLPYSEVLHLRRHFYKSDLIGEPNTPLNTPLDAITTVNQGIGNAVKSSANLRGLLKFTGILKDEDITAHRKRFMDEYLTLGNDGGVAATDAKAEYVPLTNDAKIVNAPQMKELRDMVYRYYGVNEKIVNNTFSETEWDAFYEGMLEPLALQLGLEFTGKLFTAGELSRGNEIVFESNRLQYVSVKTKVDMVERLMPLGILSINQALEVFNLAPVADGDKRLISLNYVDASKQNQYQVGDDTPTKEGDEVDGQTVE